MDLIGLQKTLDKFNEETIPKLESLINSDLKTIIDEIHALLDRLDGTRIDAKISIPPRGSIGT